MKKPAKFNPFKYYATGFQVAASVFVTIFVGYQLDKFFEIKNYYITLTLAILSIFYVLINLINRVKKGD